MRFVRCGSKLFRPDAVTAVHLDRVACPAAPGEVVVTVPGGEVIFRGAEAEAVRRFFDCIPTHDLLRRDGDDEAPEAATANHVEGEC
jgi:hypothetical protein